MHATPSRLHATPSSDSACLISYTGSGRPATSLHDVAAAYHMRHIPPSRRTNGVVTRYGSTGLRSRIGPSCDRVKVTPPSWLTASPMEIRYGTVTPRFQPM